LASVNNPSTVPRAIWPNGCDADISPWTEFQSGAQWSIIVASVLLSPLFVLFMAGVISRSRFRNLWRAGGVAAAAGGVSESPARGP